MMTRRPRFTVHTESGQWTVHHFCLFAFKTMTHEA